jgi:hypothetical protein
LGRRNLQADAGGIPVQFLGHFDDGRVIFFSDPLQKEGVGTTQEEFLIAGLDPVQRFYPHPVLILRDCPLETLFNRLPNRIHHKIDAISWETLNQVHLETRNKPEDAPLTKTPSGPGVLLMNLLIDMPKGLSLKTN